jgi:hypothetical protein
LDGLSIPTHNTAQILLPQISTFLKPSKEQSAGKVLGVKTRFLKNWLRAQNSSWYKKRIDALICRWHKTVEVGDCADK